VTLDTPNWREVLLVHPHSVSFNRFEQFYQMRFRHHKTATSIVRKIFDVCLSDQLLKNRSHLHMTPILRENFINKLSQLFEMVLVQCLRLRMR